MKVWIILEKRNLIQRCGPASVLASLSPFHWPHLPASPLWASIHPHSAPWELLTWKSPGTSHRPQPETLYKFLLLAAFNPFLEMFSCLGFWTRVSLLVYYYYFFNLFVFSLDSVIILLGPVLSFLSLYFLDSWRL